MSFYVFILIHLFLHLSSHFYNMRIMRTYPPFRSKTTGYFKSNLKTKVFFYMSKQINNLSRRFALNGNEREGKKEDKARQSEQIYVYLAAFGQLKVTFVFRLFHSFRNVVSSQPIKCSKGP